MRRLSLHARLFLVAALSGIAALVFAGVAIGQVLERFVVRGMDETLDTQIAIVARAIGPDGRVDATKVVALPGFDAPASGWGWQVRGPAGAWSGGTPLAADAPHAPPIGPPPAPSAPPPPRPDASHPMGSEGQTHDGVAVHLRRLTLDRPSGAVEIVAAGPRAIVDRPLLAAQGTLLTALALLAAGLAAATWIQLRYGLGPVRRLSAEIERVRTGAAEAIPLDQPAELRPLVEEVNALVAQNRQGLEDARRHLANLAHGLKTPLATLALRLSREGAAPETQALVAQLDARIAHHLRRARSGATSVGTRARSDAHVVVADLLSALRQIHAAKALTFTTDLAEAEVAVDPRDLEEVLGNVLDNAARHARAEVTIAAIPDGQRLRITIEDDGPGLSDAAMAQAMEAGVRLDETGEGYGFGLGIARELTELYGGTLTLARGERLPGLRIAITLPVAR